MMFSLSSFTRVLLDDVLAAVDAHVARHIFGQCCIRVVVNVLDINIYADHVIGPNGLLATKARVLVTNSIAFLKQFDKVAFIRRGIILEFGSLDSCMTNQESEVRKLM